jgi:hypothetical protein
MVGFVKRSKALDKIVRILYDNTSLTKFDVRAAAELALDTMEELGMSPPIIKEKSFKMLPSGEMIYEHREWESEDDE